MQPDQHRNGDREHARGSEPLNGTFRIRATGFSGNVQVLVTGTFKPASFLDYVYFTQLETSDPVTYGNEELIKAAERQCSRRSTKAAIRSRWRTKKGNS